MARIPEIKKDLQQLKKEEKALVRALGKDTNGGRRLEISSNGQYAKSIRKVPSREPQK